MRMRYRYVTYRYTGGSQKKLEHHYRQLLSDVLWENQPTVLHHSTTWRPLADILEAPEMIRVKIELAGMNEEEIEVTLYADALVISGEREDVHEYQEGFSYQEAQIRYGPFRVEVFISTPIQRDAVSARYENCMLSVDLPRLPVTQSQQVPIQRTTTKE
jgi:HSP20 family protein